MFKKFSFYKTILLALASAITLVSVSFAWFTNPKQADMGSLSSYKLGDTIIATFYQETESNSGIYTKCTGDFVSSFDASGGSVNYRIIVEKTSSDSINLNLNLLGISDISSDLKNNVYLDYSLYPVTENSDGTYTNKTSTPIISSNSGYSDDKLIANMSDENILSVKLDDTAEKVYALYYTVSLKSSPEVSGIEAANLGQLQVIGSAVS